MKLSKLRDSQLNVLTVFMLAEGPIDTVTLQREYVELGLPKQAPSGVNKRRKELLMLELIEWVDSFGTSDKGRSARRWQIRRSND
jgi:hypothetical protein